MAEPEDPRTFEDRFGAASREPAAFFDLALDAEDSEFPALLALTQGGVWRYRDSRRWPPLPAGAWLARPSGLPPLSWQTAEAAGIPAPLPCLLIACLGPEGNHGALILATSSPSGELEAALRARLPLLEAAAIALVAQAELERLEELDRLAGLGRHLASVVHELATPLQSVVSLAQLIECGAGDPPELAGRLKEASLRCREIVGDVLRFASPAPGAAEASCDLHEIALDACELDRLSGPGQVEIELESSELPRVRAEGRRLVQVLVNLLSNARRALGEGAQGGIVRVRLESLLGQQSRLPVAPTSRVARLAVEDRGPGVPAGMAERIFEPFFTTHHAGEGSGLGLGVSRAIVESFGGRLYLDESWSEGARFVCELPAAEPSAGSVEEEAATPALPEALEILVVDDDPRMLATYEALLELEGHRTIGAHGVEEAFGALRERTVDLVVSDLRLGQGTGLDLHRALVEAGSPLATRFILATGDIASEESRRHYESFEGPVLLKPFRLEDLLAAFARALD